MFCIVVAVVVDVAVYGLRMTLPYTQAGVNACPIPDIPVMCRASSLNHAGILLQRRHIYLCNTNAYVFGAPRTIGMVINTCARA